MITFDCKGFGARSDFNFTLSNLYHQEYILDFSTIMQWAKENNQAAQIGVLAFSIGTYVATVGYPTTPYDFYIGEGFVF